MLLALLLAASASASGKLAVLELRSRLSAKDRAAIDVSYLSDVVRTGAKDRVPGLAVMTRENVLVLLESTGKKLEDCEGECEVDTGRRLGADYVVTGDVLKFGTSFKVNLRLHDTRSAQLLQGATVTGKSADDIDEGLSKALDKLFGPLREVAPSPEPAAKPAAPQPDAAAAREAPPASSAAPRPAPAPNGNARLAALLSGKWDCHAEVNGKDVPSTFTAQLRDGKIAMVSTAPGAPQMESTAWVEDNRFHTSNKYGDRAQGLDWLDDGYVATDPAGFKVVTRRSGKEMSVVVESTAAGSTSKTETRCRLAD